MAKVFLFLALPALAQTYRVAGTVLSATEGHPLAGVRVTLSDVRSRKPVQSLLTTADGQFEFLNVPAGKYPLIAAKRGYTTAFYNQHEDFNTAIVTGAGVDTEHLTFHLAPLARIYGQVLDEHGDPVREAQVTLWRDDHRTGISRVARANIDTTDDRGAYEFAALPPATYFLSVQAEPWYATHPTAEAIDFDRALDVIYPTTYYAGATESEDATPILIRGGNRVQLDLHLLPIAPLHVRFHVPTEGTFSTPMLSKQVFDDEGLSDIQRGQMVSRDVFEIIAAPGHYRANFPETPNAPGREIEIDVSEDNQELDLSSLTDATASLSITIETADHSPPPAEFFVMLTDAKNRRENPRSVDPQHPEIFPNLRPGRFTITGFGSSRPYAITSITRLGPGNDVGKPVPGNQLDIAPGAKLSVRLTVVAGTATVEGVVERNGKPFDGAMVVLIPSRPESNLADFRRDQSDLDGTFGLPIVTPGNYTVVAIEDGWDLDWSQPAAIARYGAHGQKITVPPNTRTVHLPTPLELQSK